MTDERSIADAHTEDAPEERSLGDIQKEAAEFDMESWLDGIRPVRRAVRVFLANDDDALNVAVELEKIVDKIDSLPDGPEVDALIDRALELQEVGKGQWVVMEAHSQERREADETRLIEQLNLDTKSEETKIKHGTILIAHLAAAQIVEPKITGPQLIALSKDRWHEAYKIINLASELNSHSMSDTKVFNLDFSRRRSGRR